METPENTPKKSGPPSNCGTPRMQAIEREKQHGQTPQTPGRAIGSLVLLTQKFVDLMIRNGGEIDLKDVSWQDSIVSISISFTTWWLLALSKTPKTTTEKLMLVGGHNDCYCYVRR